MRIKNFVAGIALAALAGTTMAQTA
ncbi:MAG: hypothetical protein RIQ66_1025, partial [Pseudomonadota bacterium]